MGGGGKSNTVFNMTLNELVNMSGGKIIKIAI